MDYRNIITMEPGKRGGKPCIRGMRITVYDVELLSRVVYGGSRGVLLHPEPILEDDAVQDLWQVMRGT